MAAKALERFGLKHYVADIEHRESGSYWDVGEIRTYFSTLKDNTHENSKFMVSTFGFIDGHEPELIMEAEPFLVGFAPQIYWFWYPNKKMLTMTQESSKIYPLNDSAAYMRLCIKRWRKYTEKPLVAGAQSYWGEAQGYTQTAAEREIAVFR